MLLLATHAMGTRFEFVLHGEDEGELRAVAEEAIRVVEEWHGRLSRFEPGSDVSRLNRDASSRVDSQMRELLELCERVRVESGGAFDVQCGEGGTLDFGAVGKGWALDRAAEVVRECGVRSALLHGGTSSVVAIGERAWPIAVRSDGEPKRVELLNAAMGVSAPRGRRDAQGNGHIIDPRTGVAAMVVDTAVVVVDGSVANAGALADAWSTAMVVMGARGERMGIGFDSYVHTERGWQSHARQTMGAA